MDLRPFMERWGMLPPSGGTMLVAVSGGRDSVCLLHYLATMPRDFSVICDIYPFKFVNFIRA